MTEYLYDVPGALERKKAGFVSAALKALEPTVAALPGVRSSEAITALLALAQPKENGEAAPKEVSQKARPRAYRCQNTCKSLPGREEMIGVSDRIEQHL